MVTVCKTYGDTLLTIHHILCSSFFFVRVMTFYGNSCQRVRNNLSNPYLLPTFGMIFPVKGENKSPRHLKVQINGV